MFVPVDSDGWMVRENAKQGREEDVQKRDECLGRAPRKKFMTTVGIKFQKKVVSGCRPGQE